MGWSVRLGTWNELAPELLSAIQTFAGTFDGKRAEPIDDVWWARSTQIAPPASPHAMSCPYSHPLTTAFESVIEDSLGRSRWGALHHEADQFVVFPPFGFDTDVEPPFWGRVTSRDQRALLGDPIVLLDHYQGAFDDEDGRAYTARGKAIFDRLYEIDDVDELFGAEYAMENLLREAWDLEVPVYVYW